MTIHQFSKKSEIVMTIHQFSKKSISLFLAAWIRLFIMSGIEILNRIGMIKSPKAYVQWLPRSEWTFPISSWIYEDEMCYCLVSRRSDQEVTIHELPRLGRN